MHPFLPLGVELWLREGVRIAIAYSGGITESCGLSDEKRRRTLGVGLVPEHRFLQGKDTPHEKA